MVYQKLKLKPYVKVLFLLVLSTTFTACNRDVNNVGKVKEVESKVDVSDENINQINVSKSVKVIDGASEQVNSYEINGEKYQLLSAEFKAGSKVKNVFTNEIGTVMGSFYISINDKKELDKIGVRFKIKPISYNTLELIPLEKKAELIEVYKKLKNTPELLHVEMNIMFLGTEDGFNEKDF